MRNNHQYIITFVVPSTGDTITAGNKAAAVAEARARGLVPMDGPVHLVVKDVRPLR